MTARAAAPLITGWRGFHDALRRAALAASAGGTPLALMMIELAAPAWPARQRGPEVMGLVAAELGGRDVLARYRRDRLAVVLAEADLAAALAHAERLGDRLPSLTGGVAPAIGVAQFHDEEPLGHLIQRALEALARATALRRPAAAVARATPDRLPRSSCRAALARAGRSGGH